MIYLFIALEVFLVMILLLTLASLILIFISGFVSSGLGAPYVPARRQAIKAALSFGGVQKSDIFYDLGCGDGRALICAVKEFGARKAVGYEKSLWPYLKANFLIRRLKLRERAKILYKNFMAADLGEATFVYIYLFPKIVSRLAYKFEREGRPGLKILSLDFPIDIQKHPGISLLKTGKIAKMTAYLYEKI
ncbi:MAG: hypothetical protein AAB566_00275 [Patescibacteria group bacterium]